MCTMSNSLQMRLDPPKVGKQNFFLALVASIDVEKKVVTLNAVHLLGEADEKILAAYKTHCGFVAKTNLTPREKRPIPFTPTKAKRCRALGRSPSET